MKRRRTAPHVVPPAIVRAAIARAVLGQRAGNEEAENQNQLDTPVLGQITLLPHQREAVSRLRTILQREHVALLADDVGMGKTFTALAVARGYAHTLVVAPAALVSMWRDAVARTGIRPIQVVSMHGYSRARAAVQPSPSQSLVIIDEAHHFRSPTTRRYRAVATVCSGCDVLLLSATPIHNTPRDLRALFALSRGEDADLRETTLGRLIVRRHDHTTRPQTITRPAIEVPHDPDLLGAILALPAPLPAHDGAVAGALIRLGLLRAWCSSDAALEGALRRRLLRGEALQQALDAGRHPTASELRSWLVGEHEVQLAFPELLTNHSPETGPLREVLQRHLDAARALLARQKSDRRGDAARAAALRSILSAHPNTPVVAFTQFAETVRAVQRALADIAGVGALTGKHGWIASGAISRQDALAHFAPVAQGRPPPPPHQRIRLLLTTDLLAEGVNLQDAGVVVHLDFPWTDALRRQRVGRCVRVGSPHVEVVVYAFQPPADVEAVLRLHARLQRKARLASRFVGTGNPSVTSQRLSPADATHRLRAMLKHWNTGDLSKARHLQTPLVAEWGAGITGFLAVCRWGNGDREVIGGVPDSRFACGRRWRLSRAPRVLLRLVSAAAEPSHSSRAPLKPDAAPPTHWPAVHRVLQRWSHRQTLAGEVGDRDRQASRIQRLVYERLRGWLQRLPPSRRLQGRVCFQGAVYMLSRAYGAAAESALAAWMADDRTPPGAPALETQDDWADRWREYPVLAHAARHGTLRSHGEAALAIQVDCVLLLTKGDPA